MWTIAGGAGRLSSKPRPALVVQSDLFGATDFVTVALLTTTEVESPTRVLVPAGGTTDLSRDSYVMADKLHTVPRTNLGRRCGIVPTGVMVDVERAILVYLGIAG